MAAEVLACLTPTYREFVKVALDGVDRRAHEPRHGTAELYTHSRPVRITKVCHDRLTLFNGSRSMGEATM